MLQHVVRSTVIDAPIERVWAVLRDFNSHDRWHDVVAAEPHRGRRAQRPGRLRAQLHAEGRQPHPRAAARAVGQRAQEHLLHRRGDRAAAALRRDRHAEAGDRRRPHVLALGVDLRDAARAGARAARDGGARRLRGRLREPAPPSARRAATCAAVPAPPAMPSALPLPSRSARRAPLRRARGPAARRRRSARRRAAGEVRIRQRAIGVNYLDVYLRKGWIPAMLPLPGVPGMEAVGTVVDVGAGVSGLLPGDRVAYLGPVPGAYCSVRTVPAEWVVRLPAAIDDDARGGDAAEGHHRRHPAARPRPRAAPARACSSMRRPAASACLSARGRGVSAPTSSAPSRATRRRGSRASTAARIRS